MTHKLLVTTFTNDIPQFKMFCYCLNKNWHGQKDLIVCLNTGDDQQVFFKITSDIFGPEWTVTIVPTIHPFKYPTTGQQANAVFYSVTSGVDDVIAWDCKDFLIRPCDFSTFTKGSKHRITYFLTEKLVDLGYDMSGLIEEPIDHFRGISNLRPYIWNVKQLTLYWEQLNKKFGNYQTWDNHYPGGCEYYGYYICARTNPEKLVKFLTHAETPLLFGGGWTHQTYDGIVKEANDFDQSTERLVWKHSRKLQDPRCLDVTRSVLIKHGIDQQFVDQVYG